jgi:hypothetical protein
MNLIVYTYSIDFIDIDPINTNVKAIDFDTLKIYKNMTYQTMCPSTFIILCHFIVLLGRVLGSNLNITYQCLKDICIMMDYVMS